MRIMGLESLEHIDFSLYILWVYMPICLIINKESGAMVLHNGWSGSFLFYRCFLDWNLGRVG